MFAGFVLVSLAALAALGAADRRDAAARAGHTAITVAVDKAQAVLDRQRRGLDALARIAATQPDDTAQQFLDRLTTSAPGIRAAALADAAGTVQLRSAAGSGLAALDSIAADAGKLAAADAAAPLLVTRTVGDGDAALVGLARPWTNADGALAGIALVAIDQTAFAALDLIRTDGSPLFGGAAPAAAARAAIDGVPLLASAAIVGDVPAHGLLSAALAVVGAASLVGLLAVLRSRLAAARRRLVRQAAVERALRGKLAAASDVADRIDEINRTKSRFFAQVTHELRTPLNAILGFSETIRQQIFGPVANPRYLEYAGLIHDAGGHLLSLINDLLDEARIEAGRMEIAPIRVAAPALARSALDLVEMLAAGRDITMATSGLASCPDLNIDPRAMKQVLVNLLSNAIKYTPPGGRIDMRFIGRDDGSVAIEVGDTGIGMSAEDLRVAFEPFGRAGGIEARRQQGTGLGLSLARALVRLHGGELTLASRLNFGTTATVVLPQSAVFAAATPAPRPLETEAPAKAA
ncbi:MAG TPA: HAMP domain-containing sensor histidine kinase [Stellaceae bacterium]|nr:HAMP domain-containing sensor histidine kinase [Stellaceae bacterium]